ncbi:MAG TPA: DNA cytosine methyltransferase [Candidatus Wunengus sp. YC61]|uniref:DNA cytosine methyltransferase n=1 Tax=Candidatus Wunengus sp. YC61 TaxID=3367698 RepID=UPI004028D2D0
MKLPIDVKYLKDKENFVPVLSFFTGGGFLDLGFIEAGFEVVWTNENNNVFADMYEFAMPSLAKSFKSGKIFEKIRERRSVENITSEEIIKNAFPGGSPALFGIIGGPPCPDFANGGKHRGHEGNHGRLSKTFIDHICSIKPSFFVFENVHGLLRTEKHRAFLETLEKQLEDASYCIDRTVLNSLDFGLAQDRERVFLIGIKKNLVKLIPGIDVETSERKWFPWPSGKYRDARSSFEWPTVAKKGEAPRKPREIPEELMVFQLLSNIPDDLPNAKEAFKPYSKKFKTVREGDTSGKSFKRLHRYRYSPTACYGNNEVHLHPWENRRLTVREAMRIQGISDGYALPEPIPLTAKFKMIGNGVPVPLAQHIAISLHKLLKPLLLAIQ